MKKTGKITKLIIENGTVVLTIETNDLSVEEIENLENLKSVTLEWNE